MESAVDDDLVKIVLIDRYRLDRDVRDVICAVVEENVHADVLPFREFYGIFRCKLGELFHGLVYRHELRALHDPLACLEFRVLSDDLDLAGQSPLGQSVHGLTCERVVAAHYRIGFRDGLDVVVDEFVRELRTPVVAVIGKQDVLAIFFADCLKAFHDLGNVVVALGSHYLDDVAIFTDVFADGFGHVGADGLVVERDIQVGVCIPDDTVIADDGNARILGSLDRICQPVCIDGNDNDRIHAYAYEVFYL